MRLKAEHISYKYPGGSREVLSDVSLELGSTDVSVWTICRFRGAVTARCR